MPRTRPPYPPEFRREAIELVRSSGEPIGQIAKDLGCTEQTLQISFALRSSSAFSRSRRRSQLGQAG